MSHPSNPHPRSSLDLPFPSQSLSILSIDLPLDPLLDPAHGHRLTPHAPTRSQERQGSVDAATD